MAFPFRWLDTRTLQPYTLLGTVIRLHDPRRDKQWWLATGNSAGRGPCILRNGPNRICQIIRDQASGAPVPYTASQHDTVRRKRPDLRARGVAGLSG